MSHDEVLSCLPPQLKMSKDIDNWSAVFTDWKASGLKQAEYCKRHNIHFNSFTHQRGRQRKRHVKFSRVVACDDITAPSLSSARIIIKLSSGAVIELPNDSASLKLVLTALGDIQ